MKYQTTTLTGFEPARVEPNGFQVHRLNHSATVSFTLTGNRTRGNCLEGNYVTTTPLELNLEIVDTFIIITTSF